MPATFRNTVTRRNEPPPFPPPLRGREGKGTHGRSHSQSAAIDEAAASATHRERRRPSIPANVHARAGGRLAAAAAAIFEPASLRLCLRAQEVDQPALREIDAGQRRIAGGSTAVTNASQITGSTNLPCRAA